MRLPTRASLAGSFSLALLALASCGSVSRLTGNAPGSTGSNPLIPAISHVVIVVEENHSYSEVIGSGAMPFLNRLASQYALATNYFADLHPSIPNYFMLTAGQIVTVDDSFTGTVDVDNIVRSLTAGGRSWKSYAEDLPGPGYTGGDSGSYWKRHNPLAYFNDVADNPAERVNLVPFPQFASDLASGALPNLSFVVPNPIDDAHDGTLAQADAWLQANIGPLISSQQFEQDGLLIIVFDESEDFDVEHGGGHVAMVLVGPHVKRGFQSTTFYQHESTLKLMLQALGANAFPGSSAGASSMSEFFTPQ
jgi:acid phosphatase